MIEMMILAAILSSVTLRVAGNVAVDGFFAARGMESPRYTRAKARRTPGAASRYWSEVWDDAWTNASKKRADKRAGRSSTARPRGAATSFWAGLAQDGRRAAGRRWEDGWVRLDEMRRERATRPRPGQQTVPGTVVPNAPSRPEDEGRPEDRPRPESSVVLDEDDSPAPVPQDDPTDPTVPGQDDDQTVPDYPPDSGPDNQTTSPLASTTTQEGTTMTTTIPTDTEVIGLDPAIDYCGTTVQACNAMVHSLEQTEAAIIAGGVTGVASAAFANARELFGQIATVMGGAGQEFVAHKRVQEAYDANPGAGTREWLGAGR